jgi:hypothetical protein
MYAVFTVVRFDDEEQAVESLHRDIIPALQKTPGFVSGTWFGDDKPVGHGLVLFETEDQAKQGIVPADMTLPGGVVVVSSDVYRVQGQA